MSDVVITVRGEHETRVPPERAVVRLTIRAEGTERGPVVERVTALADPLRDDLRAHQRSGEVADWSSASAAVWSERPWNAEGRRDPVVHHASIEITADFTDFGALSWWLGDVADGESVDLAGVEWALHPETRRRVEQDAATAAVQAAVERARAYADALGLDAVTPVEIADAGLRDGGEPSPKMLRAMTADGGTAIGLQPADIVIRAVVEARFHAR